MILPAIQSFVSADTVGEDGSQCIIDWDRGKVLVYKEGSPYTITRFNFSTGSQEQTASLTGSTHLEPMGFSPSDNSLYTAKDFANYTGVVRSSAESLTELNSNGTPSSFGIPPPSIRNPGTFAIVNTLGTSWIVTTAVVPIGDEGHAISVLVGGSDIGFLDYYFSLDGAQWSTCAGPQSSREATVYILAGPTGVFPTPNEVILYATTISELGGISTSSIGAISPTDIDPEWTKIYQLGIVYDATDGNVLVSVWTDEAVTNPTYIAKLNSVDASVMWKVPIAGMVNASLQMSSGRIEHGRFACFCWSAFFSTVFLINTIDGTYTSFDTGLVGLVQSGGQCFDDTNGCIVAHGSFSKSGSGGPVQLNGTPDNFSGWYALYVMERFIPPRTPGGKTSYARIWQNNP